MSLDGCQIDVVDRTELFLTFHKVLYKTERHITETSLLLSSTSRLLRLFLPHFCAYFNVDTLSWSVNRAIQQQ